MLQVGEASGIWEQPKPIFLITLGSLNAINSVILVPQPEVPTTSNVKDSNSSDVKTEALTNPGTFEDIHKACKGIKSTNT